MRRRCNDDDHIQGEHSAGGVGPESHTGRDPRDLRRRPTTDQILGVRRQYGRTRRCPVVGPADDARHHVSGHRTGRSGAGPRLRLRRPGTARCAPGDSYELLKALAEKMDFRRPPARVLANIVRSIGFEHLKPIAPPPQEALPRWRRIAGFAP